MGNTYEVSIWAESPKHTGAYRYESIHCGESLMVALYVMFKLKWAGAHCIKLEWRP